MTPWLNDLLKIFIAGLLVLINGFFVDAEFALVKIRQSRLGEMVKERRPLASTASWLVERLDASLSACQLGITMASLGLGWIGEPAVAHLLRPLLVSIGIQSQILVHGVAFAIAFTTITAFHLVIGEQAPKIAALRRPETAALWSALPLKIFYYLSYPYYGSAEFINCVFATKSRHRRSFRA
jgi:CBS domain containing-hemolysin-like protein